jgi:hypothetical protein
MSKFARGLVLVFALALSLVASLPARANINETIGNVEDIDTVDLTDLATGKYRQKQKQKPKPRASNNKNKQVGKTSPNKARNTIGIDRKSSHHDRKKYADKLTNKQSLTGNRPLPSMDIAPPFDSSILSDLF